MIKLNQGSDKFFTLWLTSAKTKLPVDLTDLKSAKCRLKKSDSSVLELTLLAGIAVEGSPKLGMLGFTLTEVQTALLKDGTGDIEIQTEIGPGVAGTSTNDFQWFLFPGELQVGKRKLV